MGPTGTARSAPLTRVAIIEQDQRTRHRWATLIEAIDGCHVIAATSHPDGLTATDATTTDLVVISDAVAGFASLATAARVGRPASGTRIIVVGTRPNDREVLRALKLGTSGYVLRASAIQRLRFAVETVRSGGVYLDPGVVCVLRREGRACRRVGPASMSVQHRRARAVPPDPGRGPDRPEPPRSHP